MPKYIVYFSNSVRVPIGPFESRQDADAFCVDLAFSEIKELIPPENFSEKKWLLERISRTTY